MTWRTRNSPLKVMCEIEWAAMFRATWGVAEPAAASLVCLLLETPGRAGGCRGQFWAAFCLFVKLFGAKKEGDPLRGQTSTELRSDCRVIVGAGMNFHSLVIRPREAVRLKEPTMTGSSQNVWAHRQ